jgi:hypothetical protein
MSGGSLDYLCYKIDSTIEDIAKYEYKELQNYYGKNGGDVWEHVKPFQTDRHKKFLEHLKLVSQALHDIEWAIDGDINFGDEIEAIDKVLKNGNSEVRG